MNVELGPRQQDATLAVQRPSPSPASAPLLDNSQQQIIASLPAPPSPHPANQASSLPIVPAIKEVQAAPTPCAAASFFAKLQALIVTHYLPLAFAVSLTVALAYPAPGKAVIHVTILGNIHLIQEILIGIVFFISGLTLKTDDAAKALVHWRGVLFGAASILLFTPCLGFIFRIIPFQLRAFNIGLMIFSIVPTTLGIGVALVRACKGNEGLSLILTISTNMLGVFTMPLWVKFLFIDYSTEGLDMNIKIEHLLVKLLITITGPALVGKIVREFWKGAPRFTTKYKVPLSLFSTTCLAVIVWQTLSSAREVLFSAPAVDIIAVILLAVGQHIFYLSLTAFIVVYVIKMPLEEAIAVAITAGQKSAPVAVTVISYITGSPAVQGLLSIPAICGQLNMILVGSIISPWLSKLVIKTRAERKELTAALAAAQLAELGVVTNSADTSFREVVIRGTVGNFADRPAALGASQAAGPSDAGEEHAVSMTAVVVAVGPAPSPPLSATAAVRSAVPGDGEIAPAAVPRRPRG